MIFELVKLRVWRDNIWMQIHGANVFRRVGRRRVKIEVNSTVAGWDDHTVYTQRIRNYTDKPIEVEVRRPFAGHIVFRSQLEAAEPRLSDRRSTQPRSSRRKTSDLLYEIVQHQGQERKQNNVTIEEAKIEP